jgi:hypothetical protein
MVCWATREVAIRPASPAYRVGGSARLTDSSPGFLISLPLADLPGYDRYSSPNIVSYCFPIRLQRQVVRSRLRFGRPLAQPELGESPAQIKNAGSARQERGPRVQKIEELIHGASIIP